ncbi:MAG TPA: hypothetical protein VH280_11530 [Verrucomicrobiae bacterium]|jgi:hypothetical protein|nr:hypothetical protein [Verrucomicrobiae bacterium]
MRERPEQIAKSICLALGALLFLRFVWILWTANPLAHVVVPDLPTLPDDSAVTNAVVMGSTNRPEQVQGAMNTNLPAAMTNSTQRAGAVIKEAGPGGHAMPAPGTNAGMTARTNVETNSGTNVGASVASSDPGKPSSHSSRRRRGQMGGAMGFPGMAGRKVALAPAIQASVDRITDSEILGPVIRPLPMALLGIAGKVAFLRTPDGVTGLVKQGDELGGIKLVRIGVNRVLVEENGQQKELTIFDGIGGETLLDKSSKSSNEKDNP